MDAQTFTTNLSLEEIEQRLSGLDKFNVKDKTASELAVNVGSALKFRLIGVYLNKDYQAPLAIDAADNGDGTTTVELSARGTEGAVITTGTAEQFFNDAFAELRATLEG
ncbi:hypothetical protein SAMN04488531_1996 [Corynebacterium coyleae]|uniref:Uncharacterized protein n=1 Tax=Corynebacterium coyleae TaxID=53374 RepID=A0ABX8KTD9_9CORY|nr:MULTISPECIES: hypothetical protein [Corynebacterium]MDK6493439.1 hypothetical protein [Corynebacterium coyleae]MDK8800295.1 hypothetical protein [Corynebacterium coyleae]MDK8822590.1 hypothetical protein [Corynebacterium coyleae]OFL92381.1 hypothetical protein HMPREF2734_01400 [Corynebacterium sp. HMSC055D05]OFO32202.1 hypothetical protein HMPREF3048_03605 [Corynebacterium sp. HMSC075D04]